MRRVGLSALFRLAAGAVLLAGGVALTPGRAAAGCGDYVRVADQLPNAHELPVEPATPCHGCSDRPNTPAPLTAPPTAPSDPKVGVARFVADLGGDRNPGWVRSPAAAEPAAGSPLAVFHPPRPV